MGFLVEVRGLSCLLWKADSGPPGKSQPEIFFFFPQPEILKPWIQKDLRNFRGEKSDLRQRIENQNGMKVPNNTEC